MSNPPTNVVVLRSGAHVLPAPPLYKATRERYHQLCREREAEIARAVRSPAFRAKIVARRLQRRTLRILVDLGQWLAWAGEL